MSTRGSMLVRLQHPHIMQADASAREQLKQAAAQACGVERSAVQRTAAPHHQRTLAQRAERLFRSITAGNFDSHSDTLARGCACWSQGARSLDFPVWLPISTHLRISLQEAPVQSEPSRPSHKCRRILRRNADRESRPCAHTRQLCKYRAHNQQERESVVSERILIVLVLVLCSAAAAAQAVSPGMTVHRVQAGALDASGWSSASSTFGGFDVRLPCLFNDFSIKAEASEPVLEIDAVACLREDQRKYSATRFKYREGAAAARKSFARISGPQRWEGETARRQIMLNGFPAVHVDFRSTSRCGASQAILVGSDLVTLTAEAPRSACDGLLEQAATFFDSLQVGARAMDPADQQKQAPSPSEAATEPRS
jgi:hypothetical protein